MDMALVTGPAMACILELLPGSGNVSGMESVQAERSDK
jgi:hypothetical protein